MQPPGAPTRDWLDNVFEMNHLPRPNVQVESTMLLALPALIAETGQGPREQIPSIGCSIKWKV